MKTKELEKGQMCLCFCPDWCSLGYQVATWNGKVFECPDVPNDEIFDDYVKGYLPLNEDGEPKAKIYREYKKA